MVEYTLSCGDLVLTAKDGGSGWCWMIDSVEAKNAAVARNEDAAKAACLNVAKSRFRARGIPIPAALSDPAWTMLTSSAKSGPTRQRR